MSIGLIDLLHMSISTQGMWPWHLVSLYTTLLTLLQPYTTHTKALHNFKNVGFTTLTVLSCFEYSKQACYIKQQVCKKKQEIFHFCPSLQITGNDNHKLYNLCDYINNYPSGFGTPPWSDPGSKAIKVVSPKQGGSNYLKLFSSVFV